MSEAEAKVNTSQEKPSEDGDAKIVENGETEEKAAEQPKEMRSVVLTSFGGLKSVKVLKKPEPTLNAGEVLIRVKACGLNFQDLMVRLGAIDSPPKTPFIMGLECAGEIEKVGENVDEFQVGDRVVALPEYRAWAELVSVPAKYVYKIPDDMSFTDASAITMNYVVAYILLFELGNVKSGEKILLHSAGGSVGQAVVQLSKTIPDVKVFGIASKAKHEKLKDSVEHLLERGSDYASEVRKTSPEGVDVVFDCICGDECNRGYNLLKPMGRYILFGSSTVVTGETKSLFSAAKAWWQVDKVSPIKLFYENKNICGFNLRHLLYQQNGAAYVKEIVKKVFDLWKSNKIKPVIDSTWAWEDIPEAMQKLHDRKNIGKLILDPSLEPKPKPAPVVKNKKSNSVDKEEKQKEEEQVNGSTEEQDGQTAENSTS
ncbi:UNVERIFIED_CONTAM: hypothetical protein PYX00_000424 [Menopon gallinae]|uniref:Enoyl reductase (ER) domain-containing protein n=1 Tax=Menopon gallinae TaxID=328185 RepID=A0AAW2I9P9_9NEOP